MSAQPGPYEAMERVDQELYALGQQRAFDRQVAEGKCIICGDEAKPTTRYCGGSRGCPVGPR